jgi:hypothetical protein
MIVSLVAVVLGLCGPSHVARFVMAVIVDAVKFVSFGWARSNVRKERREVIAPAVTYGDATAAVVVEGFIARLVAAAFHRVPYAVLRPFRQSVSNEMAPSNVSAKTTTRSRVAGAQSFTKRYGSASAITNAVPASFTWRGGAIQHREPSVTAVAHVNQSWICHLPMIPRTIQAKSCA